MSQVFKLSNSIPENPAEVGSVPSSANHQLPFRRAIGVAALAVLSGCADPANMGDSFDPPVEQTEQPLVASWSNLSAGHKQWNQKTFTKAAGHRYVACLNPTAGNPDLYGHYVGAPTLNSKQFFSVRSGLAPDCIWFNSSSGGTYYLGMYGYQNTTNQANLWVTDSTQQEVPSGFSKALNWPIPGYTSPVQNGEFNFADFNSPWGNNESGNLYFFPEHTNYIHSGVDISAPPGTQVKAVCDGPVVTDTSGTNSSSGAGWGYYAGQECTKNGNKISVAYVHLNSSGRAAKNTQAVAGQTTMGTIYDMNVAGEEDHLHLAICKDNYANCLPHRGALPNTAFPGKMINPSITTNPGLYK